MTSHVAVADADSRHQIVWLRRALTASLLILAGVSLTSRAWNLEKRAGPPPMVPPMPTVGAAIPQRENTGIDASNKSTRPAAASISASATAPKLDACLLHAAQSSSSMMRREGALRIVAIGDYSSRSFAVAVYRLFVAHMGGGGASEAELQHSFERALGESADAVPRLLLAMNSTWQPPRLIGLPLRTARGDILGAIDVEVTHVPQLEWHHALSSETSANEQLRLRVHRDGRSETLRLRRGAHVVVSRGTLDAVHLGAKLRHVHHDTLSWLVAIEKHLEPASITVLLPHPLALADASAEPSAVINGTVIDCRDHMTSRAYRRIVGCAVSEHLRERADRKAATVAARAHAKVHASLAAEAPVRVMDVISPMASNVVDDDFDPSGLMLNPGRATAAMAALAVVQSSLSCPSLITSSARAHAQAATATLERALDCAVLWRSEDRSVLGSPAGRSGVTRRSASWEARLGLPPAPSSCMCLTRAPEPSRGAEAVDAAAQALHGQCRLALDVRTASAVHAHIASAVTLDYMCRYLPQEDAARWSRRYEVVIEACAAAADGQPLPDLWDHMSRAEATTTGGVDSTTWKACEEESRNSSSAKCQTHRVLQTLLRGRAGNASGAMAASEQAPAMWRCDEDPRVHRLQLAALYVVCNPGTRRGVRDGTAVGAPWWLARVEAMRGALQSQRWVTAAGVPDAGLKSALRLGLDDLLDSMRSGNAAAPAE